MFTGLTDDKQKDFFEECYLPMVGEIAELVNILVDISMEAPKFPYFVN
jgi:hypothetical protein